MRGHIPKSVGIGCIIFVLILVGTILITSFKRMPLRQYYESDRDALEQLSWALFPLKEEKKVIYIRKGDDCSRYGETVEILLKQLFSQAACDSVFVSAARDGSLCCNFSIDSKTRISGVIYAEAGRVDGNAPNNVYASVFPPTSLVRLEPLSDNWIYYEALSYEEENKMPY